MTNVENFPKLNISYQRNNNTYLKILKFKKNNLNCYLFFWTYFNFSI